MKKNWNEEELLADFVLMPNELHLSMVNKTDANRLGFALTLGLRGEESGCRKAKILLSSSSDSPWILIKHLIERFS